MCGVSAVWRGRLRLRSPGDDAADHPGDGRLGVDWDHMDLGMSAGEDAEQFVREGLADLRYAREIQLDALESLKSLRNPLRLGPGNQRLALVLGQMQRDDGLVERVFLR